MLLALLQQQGYPAVSALLPTTGTTSAATIEDDEKYVRERMLLPILDIEGHDIVLVTHSYSDLPGSAAARGLSKPQSLVDGHISSILGQMHIACILSKGGDGKDVVSFFGGQYPPHMRVDEPMNLRRCDDPKPLLYQDVPEPLAEAVVRGCLCPNITSFKSPIPPASWNEAGYAGCCAFIRTTKDAAIPLDVQDQMLTGTWQQWGVKDINTGHSPQLAAPEKLAALLIELSQQFAAM